MKFQFNTDSSIAGGESLATRVEAIVRARLAHIEHRLTRIEVHVGDVNGARETGDDKRCSIEIRPNGLDPISASDTAANVEAAVTSAADKVLAAYDRQIGKRTTRKGH